MKKIGITCDFYKTDRFRARLIEKGFDIKFDKPATIDGKIHLFTIEVEDKDYVETCSKLAIILKQLEIECKQSN